MILSLQEIAVFNKKSFSGKENKAGKCYFVIDYLYRNKKGGIDYNMAFIDETSYNAIKDIDSLKVVDLSKCYKFRGHYTNYKFVADEIVL